MSDSDVFNLEGGVQAEEGVDAGHLSGFTPSVPSEVRLIGIFILLRGLCFCASVGEDTYQTI